MSLDKSKIIIVFQCIIWILIIFLFAPKDDFNPSKLYSFEPGKRPFDIRKMNLEKFHQRYDEVFPQYKQPNQNFRILPNGLTDLRVRSDHIDILKNSNESYAFYVILGQNQSLKKDLRGNFWEFQLEHFGGNANVVYFSDGPLSINGIECELPPQYSKTSFQDSQLCIRSPATFDHFVEHFPNHRWYFRGTHDTFINLTGLVLLSQELEARFGDPMKTFSAAFNFHEWNHILYPQGGTGWLFSNAAMKVIQANKNRFIWHCGGSFDDVALANFMNEMNQSVAKFQDNRFIVTWPNTEGEVIYKQLWSKQIECPDKYYLWDGAPGLEPCPVKSAVSIHMHKVPMEEAWEQLIRVPDGIGVFFPNPNLPLFCRL